MAATYTCVSKEEGRGGGLAASLPFVEGIDNMRVRATKHESRRKGTVSPTVLADIVGRIVAVARPQKIVLFGSAARGAMGEDSDVDLLVVKSGRFRRGRLLEAIYRSLRGAAEAVDVLVVTPEELHRYRDDPCLIVAPALREGRLVYGS